MLGLTLTVPFSLKPSPELLSLAGGMGHPVGRTGLLVGKRDLRGNSDLAGVSERMQMLQSHTTLREEGRWDSLLDSCMRRDAGMLKGPEPGLGHIEGSQCEAAHSSWGTAVTCPCWL